MLNQKYLFPRAEAEGLASFLNPMLRLHPDKRAKASELIHHNFLEGIVVQGEIDVIRRLELEEAENRHQRDGEVNGVVTMTEVAADSDSEQIEPAQEDQKQQRVTALSQSERDAMKPVDDGSIMVEEEGEVEYDDEPPITMQHRDHHQNQVPLLNTVVPHPTHGTQRAQNQRPEKKRS